MTTTPGIPTRRLQSLLTPRGTAQEQELARRQLDRLLTQQQLAVRQVRGPEDLVCFTSILIRELFDVEPITTEAPDWAVYLVGKEDEIADAARAHLWLVEDFARVWTVWVQHLEQAATGAVPTTRYRHLFYYALAGALYAEIAHWRRRQGQRVRPPPQQIVEEQRQKEQHAAAFPRQPPPFFPPEEREHKIAAQRGAKRVAALVRLGGPLLCPRPLPRALPPWKPGRFALVEVGDGDSVGWAPTPESGGGRFTWVEVD